MSTDVYKGPTANIKINDSVFDTVYIKKWYETRLSPLLFILTLKLFLRTFNADISIQSLKVGNRVYKTAAYADDMLFFLTCPHLTIPSLAFMFNSADDLPNCGDHTEDLP